MPAPVAIAVLWSKWDGRPDGSKDERKRLFWHSKYFKRNIGITVAYGAGVPLMWAFVFGYPQLIYQVMTGVILAAIIFVDIEMYRSRVRHFKQMTAIGVSFETKLGSEKEQGWRQCQLCGQKKMCVDFIDRWMCEHCFADLHKYWWRNNPYVSKYWWLNGGDKPSQ